jgi:hypothetical protein
MVNETGTMACTQNTWQHNGVDDLYNGHWILNIGLPSGRPKKSCPFCLARGLNRGTKGHMRTIMYMQWAYMSKLNKNFVIPQTLEQFPRNPTPFPEKGLSPCSTLQDPLGKYLSNFAYCILSVNYVASDFSPCQDCVRYTPRST